MMDLMGFDEPTLELSPAEKAAVIITALPTDEASVLLEKLGPHHISAFAKATASLKEIPESALESVVEEFLDSLSGSTITLGPDAAKEVLSRIMSPDDAVEVISNAMGGNKDVWKRLATAEAQLIANFLSKGHPRAAALILSRLTPEKAAEVLGVLDAATSEIAVNLMKNAAAPSPQALVILGKAIETDILDRQDEEVEAPDAVVGAIFDNLTDVTRNPLMKQLEEKDPEFATAVQKQLFLFDDIPVRIAGKDVPTITRSVDAATLKTALGYARQRESETAEFILNNMSKRLAEQLVEELDQMGKIKVSIGGEAEAKIVRAVKGLVDSGAIPLVVADDPED